MLVRFKQDCDTYSCASINCALIPSDIYQVNVSLRVWKPTIIKVSKFCLYSEYFGVEKFKPMFLMSVEILSFIFLSVPSSI